MLVSHYRHLEKGEDEQFGPELIRRDSEERISPILMTALSPGIRDLFEAAEEYM